MSPSSRKIHRNNKSGYRGVSRHGNRWRADVTMDGVRYYLSVYDTPEEAYEARIDLIEWFSRFRG
jgi:hypothetical protein